MTNSAPACAAIVLVISASSLFSQCLETKGSWPYGPSYTVAWSDDYFCVGNGRAVMLLGQRRGSLAVIGEFLLGGSATDLKISDNLVYSVAGYAGLSIVDISDPSAPLEIGALQTTGYAYGITVAKDIALIPEGYSGFQIIDIAAPGSPTPISEVPVTGDVRKIVVEGDLALVQTKYEGLRFFDISDPFLPTEIGFFDLHSLQIYGIAVHGQLVYLEADMAEVLIVDFSDPQVPFEAGSFSAFNGESIMEVHEDLLFVAGYLARTSHQFRSETAETSCAAGVFVIRLTQAHLQCVQEGELRKARQSAAYRSS